MSDSERRQFFDQLRKAKDGSASSQPRPLTTTPYSASSYGGYTGYSPASTLPNQRFAYPSSQSYASSYTQQYHPQPEASVPKPKKRPHSESAQVLVDHEQALSKRRKKLAEADWVSRQMCLQPDWSRPFSSDEDMYRRLLPYSLFDLEGEEVKRKTEDMKNSKVKTSETLKQAVKAFESKFQTAMEKDLQRTMCNPSIENLMVDRLLQEDERLLYTYQVQLSHHAAAQSSNVHRPVSSVPSHIHQAVNPVHYTPIKQEYYNSSNYRL
eukprot:GILK01004077.1.p1 GENE.GILK01004077.1~~GILK01004077.1.p1  ORF type:complete len:307 (+),score=30.75 GILK01004077.1:121-921(+)